MDDGTDGAKLPISAGFSTLRGSNELPAVVNILPPAQRTGQRRRAATCSPPNCSSSRRCKHLSLPVVRPGGPTSLWVGGDTHHRTIGCLKTIGDGPGGD